MLSDDIDDLRDTMVSAASLGCLHAEFLRVVVARLDGMADVARAMEASVIPAAARRQRSRAGKLCADGNVIEVSFFRR